MAKHITLTGNFETQAEFQLTGKHTDKTHILALTYLQPGQADKAHALHQNIIDSLSEDQKSFILSKDVSYFETHLTHGHGSAILALLDKDRLIGQAVIHHPSAQKPDTGMVDMDMNGIAADETSVLQAVSIHPDYRGLGLMNVFVAAWVDHAQAHGRKHLLAEIDIANPASWRSFLTGGLNIVSIGADPLDGTMVYNAYEQTDIALQRRLTPTFNRHSALPAEKCALPDIEKQKHLFDEGFVATAYQDQSLVFRNLGLS